MNLLRLVCLTKKDGILRDLKTKTIYTAEGIRNEEVLELSELFNQLYRSQDENGSNFNINKYGYLMLKSGRYCMYRVKSIEDDERVFVSYAVIVPKKELTFYSMEMYGCEFFNQKISKDEIELEGYCPGEIKIGHTISFEAVVDFIKKKNGYSVRNIINTIMESSKENAYILIRDVGYNIPFTVAAIVMSFPNELGNVIEFTIDFEGRYGAAYLHYHQDENNLENKQEYAFDFIKGVKPVINRDFRFTKLVDMAYYISPDTLRGFHNFLRRFNYKKIDEGIESCYNLFNITNFGIGKMEHGEVKAALDFCINNSSPELFEEIFSNIIGKLEKSYKDIGVYTAEEFLDFLFNGIESVTNKGLISGVYDFFFNMVDYIAFNLGGFDAETLTRFYGRIRGINKDKMGDFLEFSINPKRMKFLNTMMQSDPDIYRIIFYFKNMLKNIIAAERSWNDICSIKVIDEFIQICVNRLSDAENGYYEVLEAVLESEEYFARVSTAFYNQLVSIESVSKYMEVLSKLLESMPNEWTNEAFEETARLRNGERFIFEEYEYAIKNMDNKEDIFWRYLNSENNKFYGYAKRYLPDMIMLYLKFIPSEKSDLECYKLIEYIMNDDILLDDYTTSFIVRGFEAYIPLYKPDEYKSEIIKRVGNFKREKGIRTFPDVTKILELGIWVEENRELKRMNINEIITEEFTLEDIDEGRYEYYIRWCLPNIIGFASRPEDYGVIINAFCIGGMEGKFLFECLNIIENMNGELNLICNFLFAYFYYLSPKFIFEGSAEIIENADSRIAEFLLKQSPGFLKKLDSSLKHEFKARGLSIPLQWDGIYSRASKTGGETFFQKVKKTFSRKNNN